MTMLQYSITMPLVLGLLLLCAPANPLPISSSHSAETTENDPTSPRISAEQGYTPQEGQSKDEIDYDIPDQQIRYTSNPQSFSNVDKYGNTVSRGRSFPSGNQNQLLYSSPAYQYYPLSLTWPSTNAPQNTRFPQLIMSQNGRYICPNNMYPIRNMYPNKLPYFYTPMPYVNPLPFNNVQQLYYPQNTNIYPMNPYPDHNYFIPQNDYNNEQWQTTLSQNTQQQNTYNAPSQNQQGNNNNPNQNSGQNQPGNQNVNQYPNANMNGNYNPTGNVSQNQNGYPFAGMQNGGGQNFYPGGMYPNQNMNQFPNGMPNQFTFGYQAPNQYFQYRSASK